MYNQNEDVANQKSIGADTDLLFSDCSSDKNRHVNDKATAEPIIILCLHMTSKWRSN